MGNTIDRLKLSPEKVLVLGIGLIMILGGILLNLPIASKSGESVGFINALFTATSATSVTGLVVVNTAEHWTIFGKVVIICLIQIGGLGFMTLTTLIAMILGKKIGLRDRLIIQEGLNQFDLSGVVKLTRYVIRATVTIELIGALLLSARFIPQYGLKTGIAFSLFHSISAFCNAGFDILGDSLMAYVGDPIVILTLSSLIILGGIGYTVYLDLTKRGFSKSSRRLNFHTKFVLQITAFLLLSGFAFVLLMEYNNPGTLKGLTFGDKLLAGWMQSVTVRTAGFNSIDLGKVHAATAFFMIMLMFIGGSPSSTAGGVKTTTFGTLLVAVVSMIRGNSEVELMERTIPKSLVLRALSVVFVSMALVIAVVMMLTITEDQEFLDIVFEVVSAFSTTGVTRGITSELSSVGKVVLTLTMFGGKVGPLTLAFAIAKKGRKKEGKYKYPEGKPLIG